MILGKKHVIVDIGIEFQREVTLLGKKINDMLGIFTSEPILATYHLLELFK